MTTTPTSQRTERFRHMRVVWLFGFVILASVFAALLLLVGTPRPTVRFPNGTVLTFKKITEPTVSPAASSPWGSGPGPTHLPPDEGLIARWKLRYHEALRASPAWLQRWLPGTISPYGTLSMGSSLSFGASKYRIWFDSMGPDVEVDQWSAYINGRATRGHGYVGGSPRVVTTSSRVVIGSSSKRWFYVDTDTLPSNKATLQVGFVRRAERARVEVPNPKYRPEAK